MNIIKAIFSWLSMTLAGMYGGQKNKAVRRFALPGLAIFTGWSFGWSWKYLAFLLFIPVLILGYGEHSKLYFILFESDTIVRIVYAILLSLPFFVFGWLRWIIACALLVLAFQVHAGSLGNVSWFGDFLKEDIVRYGTLSALIIFNCWKKK